jgi:hypothetical protein
VEVADLQAEEEHTLATTFPVINTEHEVSFMSACPLLGTFHRYLDLLVLVIVPYMSSIHIYELHCCARILNNLFENVSRFYFVSHSLKSNTSILFYAICSDKN